MLDTRKCFTAVDEAQPGAQWRDYALAALPAYRRWFASEGELKRPSLAACRAALQTHMPELLPLWQRLVELLAADEADARLLSCYCPASASSGCSQAVWTRYAPTLVRNYDYAPDLCEGRILKTCWFDTSVIASADCLWGVLDGMNQHGLTVSLAYAGNETTTEGFGIALILRYVLEFCRTVDEAVKVLCRVPVNMAYNVTLLDAQAQVRTVELAPFVKPNVTYKPLAVNHQGDYELSNYAMFSNSHERQQTLLAKLYDPLSTVESLVNSFEVSPLRATNYAQGFGTLYTAIYNPQLRAMEYRWPNHVRMYQSFAYFEPCTLWVNLL